jgi:hypothetical protein
MMLWLVARSSSYFDAILSKINTSSYSDSLGCVYILTQTFREELLLAAISYSNISKPSWNINISLTLQGFFLTICSLQFNFERTELHFYYWWTEKTIADTCFFTAEWLLGFTYFVEHNYQLYSTLLSSTIKFTQPGRWPIAEIESPIIWYLCQP